MYASASPSAFIAHIQHTCIAWRKTSSESSTDETTPSPSNQTVDHSKSALRGTIGGARSLTRRATRPKTNQTGVQILIPLYITPPVTTLPVKTSPVITLPWTVFPCSPLPQKLKAMLLRFITASPQSLGTRTASPEISEFRTRWGWCSQSYLWHSYSGSM
jgi:hypothetical protein